jgi:hypothetical protein
MLQFHHLSCFHIHSHLSSFSQYEFKKQELESEFDEKYKHKVKVCPRCHREILNIGSNFLIHLRQCDLHLFLQYIKQNKDKEDSPSHEFAESTFVFFSGITLTHTSAFASQ